MKIKTFVLVMAVLFCSCSSDDDSNPNCNFLLNVSVGVSLNLNLPQYSQLQFDQNVVYVPSVGNAGIIVFNGGTLGYLAWDAADPNHAQSGCSVLAISGVNAVCGCDDDNEYNLFTGRDINQVLPCTLKFYRVEQSGNMLFVSN